MTRKLITLAVVVGLLLCFLVLPISASVNVSTSWGRTYYNRNNIRYHSYTMSYEALTRPLPLNNTLSIENGSRGKKIVTTTADNCAYTWDCYAVNNDTSNTYQSVLGLYFYEPTTYYATFNNTYLHGSYTQLNLSHYINQYQNYNGYYVLSNSAPTYHYYGEVYVITADNERYILDLDEITSTVIPIYSPYSTESMDNNKIWVWEMTSNDYQGAEALLEYEYLISPNPNAMLFNIPSITELVNIYFRENYAHNAYKNGDKTLSIYTKNVSLTITTDISLYISQEYSLNPSPQNQAFYDYPVNYNTYDFINGVYDSLDYEFAYGLSITEMAYVVVAVVALGYILKLIGGG